MRLSNNIEKPQRICSIDASTNSIAFAVFDDEKLEQYGKVRFTGQNTYEKVGDAARKTKALFDNIKVDAIIIEQTIYANSPKTAANLALSQGALLGAARIAGIKNFSSVSPMEWQNFIGNKRLTVDEKTKILESNPGKSKSWIKSHERSLRKQRTINFVNINFDLKITDDDVSDAIAIGYWAINVHKAIF